MPVHVLTQGFSISRPAISRHLRVLKSAGLVAEVKKGRENLYAFKPQKLAAAKTWLDTIANSAAVPDAPAAVAAAPAKTKTVRVVKKKPDAAPAKPAPEPGAPKGISQMGFDF